MTVTSVGDLRQIIAAAWREARSHEYSLDDLVPAEMQDHFQQFKELETAREYIKEIEAHRNALQEDKDNLQKLVDIEKKKVENLPEDHKALGVHNKQLENEVQFYKDLMEGANDRSKNYQEQLRVVLAQQKATDDADKLIEDLKSKNEEQQQLIRKLSEENHKSHDIFDSMRRKDMDSLAEKEDRLIQMEHSVTKAEERYEQLEVESEDFEKAYHGLLLQIETAGMEHANALNNASRRIRTLEKVRMAAVSEANILRKFYKRSEDVLISLQSILQHIMLSNGTGAQTSANILRTAVSLCKREYEAYGTIHSAFSDEDLEQDEVREQLAGVAVSARDMQIQFQDLTLVVFQFVEYVRQKPDLWGMITDRFRSSPRQSWTSILNTPAGSPLFWSFPART